MAATIDDAQLLADYVRTRSTDALGQLIERHLDFVHAAALRQVQDAALAEDITQAVFIILARKAASIRPASLIGWLFNTTRYCAANARNSELRRRRHERQAAKPEVQMQPDDSIAISLDNALAALRSSDRQVVLLRYMEQRDFAEVATVLGISEQTARRRLSRAVERLRHLLSAAGSLLPSAAVLETLSRATPRAPVHLLAKTIATASASTTTAGAAATLATQTLHMMTWIKLKAAATIILALTVASAGSVAIVKTMEAPQAATPAAPNTPPIPDPAPAAEGAVAKFPDGLRVELVGIAHNPVEGQKWWRPDGSPLPQAPYQHSFIRVNDPGSKAYSFAFKITGLQKGWASSVSAVGGGSNGFNQMAPGECDLVVALKDSPTAALDFICATGTWQTSAAFTPNAVFNPGFVLNGIAVTAKSDPQNTTLTLTGTNAAMSALLDGGQTRFIAIDLNGNVHETAGMSGSGSIFSRKQTYTFPKIVQAQIKEFQLTTRQFNRSAHFQNISVVPGQITVPQVQIHEGVSFVASFQRPGRSVEVVGISNWPPSGTWWRPDGSPLTDIPPDYGTYTGPDPRPGERAYAVAVKLKNDSGGNPAWSWNFPRTRGIGVPQGARNVPGGSPEVYRVILPAADQTTDFRVGLATGLWNTMATAVMSDVPAAVAIDNTKISFSVPQEKNETVFITTTDNLRIDALHDLQRQLVATDTNGQQHLADLQNSKESVGKYTYVFPHVTKAQIKSYSFQTRQYEYINFNSLPLTPGQPSHVTIEHEPLPQTQALMPGEQGL